VAAVKIDPLKLTGPSADGYVLERQHTISSEFIGYDSNGHAQFDTKRSELGELVFRLTGVTERPWIRSRTPQRSSPARSREPPSRGERDI